MRKLLHSDWLRAEQFKWNTSAKSVTPVQITHRNSGLICAYKCVFQKAETALTEAARSFLKTSFVQINSESNLKPYDYLYKLGAKERPFQQEPYKSEDG